LEGLEEDKGPNSLNNNVQNDNFSLEEKRDDNVTTASNNSSIVMLKDSYQLWENLNDEKEKVKKSNENQGNMVIMGEGFINSEVVASNKKGKLKIVKLKLRINLKKKNCFLFTVKNKFSFLKCYICV